MCVCVGGVGRTMDRYVLKRIVCFVHRSGVCVCITHFLPFRRMRSWSIVRIFEHIWEVCVEQPCWMEDWTATQPSPSWLRSQVWFNVVNVDILLLCICFYFKYIKFACITWLRTIRDKSNIYDGSASVAKSSAYWRKWHVTILYVQHPRNISKVV